MSFKRNSKVTYETPRGGQSGIGKIIEVVETTRGLWYVVKDTDTGATVKLRASGLTLIA